MSYSQYIIKWMFSLLALPEEPHDKIDVVQSFDSEAEQSCVFIAVTSLGCLRAHWQLHRTAATTAGFCTMHVNELVRLNWVSQSSAITPEKWASKPFLLMWAVFFFLHSPQHSAKTLHSFLSKNLRKTVGSPTLGEPRSGDVLRGSTRSVCEWPDDGDGVERPLLRLLNAAITGDYIVWNRAQVSFLSRCGKSAWIGRSRYR